MKFGEEYTKYWVSAVTKSVDGTVIAGANEALQFLQTLEIKRCDRVLDLGCSFGRMYEILSAFSDHVYGIDPDCYAVEKARLKQYVEVHQGSAESTEFDKESFDLVFCWAVFDVVDHWKGLTEINRILKNGGKLVLTGKNDNYDPEDALAFRAEKNAFLKGFPNRFTKLNLMLRSCKDQLGFQLDRLLIFPRRGDFGLRKYSECRIDDMYNDHIGYEYLIVCHKTANAVDLDGIYEELDSQFSRTAMKAAERAGHESAKNLFEVMGID